MQDEDKRHYLLDPLEAELLACYRTLSEESKGAVTNLIASLIGNADRQILNRVVEMRVIKK